MCNNMAKIDIEPIYEEILYTFVHSNTSELDVNIDISALFDYIKNAFSVDDQFHSKILNLANRRKPSILRVDVTCTEAKYLRTKSVTGTGNYMVNIYKSSSPDHVSSTQIQFDTNNPNWSDKFSIPIVKRVDNDKIIFEVYDCGSDETDLKKNDSSSESGSIRGFKSLIKELTQSGSRAKKLVGTASVALESITNNGLNVWLNLEKNGKYNNRGQINVQMSYCVEKSKDVSLNEYQCIVQNLLMYELQASRVADYWWDGKFSEFGETVLRAYLSRVHLTKLDVAISKWTAFSKVHVAKPLSFILFDSLLSVFVKSLDDIVTETDMKYIWEGAGRLLPSSFAQIHQQIANKTHDGAFKMAVNMLTKLQDLIDRSQQRNEVFNFSIYEALENAVIDGSNEWFETQLEEQNISMITDSENISKIQNFIQKLCDDLTQAMLLDEIFNAHNLRYSETLFLVYDEKLSNILENILNETDSDWQILHSSADQPDIIQEAQEKNITVALFQLYLTLKELLVMAAKITNNNTENQLFKLNSCQIWFSGALTHWLELSVEKALTRIERAVDKDKFVPEHDGAKYSSSAIDTLGIFYQVKYIWEQLEWTDDLGSCMIIGKIIYDICRLCAFYANKVQSSLESLHLTHYHSRANFEVTQQWCLAINNIEFIRANINTFVNEISIENMVNRISSNYNSFEAERAAETFQNIIDYLNDVKNRTILDSITQVIQHLTSAMRTDLKLTVKSKDFTTKSIGDLLEYIDKSMFTLRTDLNTINFDRSVELLWVEIIKLLEDIITMGVQNRNPPNFFSNLKHFFYNIVYIVTTVEPSNENFMKDCPSLLYINNLLQLNALETPSLVHQYHLDRERSQIDSFNPDKATLTTRCRFHENDLIIEIINARNLETVLPSNNPKCNPIVKVHILPVNKCEYTTKLYKNTTVPLIDETFTIKLQPTERTCDRALILFTVWNRSIVFKTEQFLGECYIAFKDIPNNFVEKQTHLNLTRSGDATKTVLKILEARTRYDKEAQVFLNGIVKQNTLYPKCCFI